MFFIGPGVSSSSSGVGKATSDSPRPDFTGPEGCVNERMVRMLDDFAPSSRVRFLSYRPGFSRMTAEEDSELLRAVGGATHSHRNDVAAKSSERFLDGLSLNLIREAILRFSGQVEQIHGGRSILGKAKLYDLEEFFDTLLTPSGWEGVRPTLSGSMERSFTLPIGGALEKLIFVAKLDPESSNRVCGIQELRITGSGKPRTTEGKLFKLDLNEILADHFRRSEIAADYAAASRVSGIPQWLRDTIDSSLAAVGIAEGSYSRAAFSSGRFPYAVTQIPVGRGHATLLNFQRCESCGVVKGLSISGSGLDQQTVCTGLSHELNKWHQSVCPEWQEKLSDMRRWEALKDLERERIRREISAKQNRYPKGSGISPKSYKKYADDYTNEYIRAVTNGKY